MAKIKVFTDSAADIPKHLLDELDISVIPLKVHIDGVTYIDGVTLDKEDFYDKLKASKQLPSTSQPSPLDFAEAFRKAAEEGAEEIISINLSSAMSGTYQSAVLAISMLEDIDVKVTVIDSKAATYVYGMIVVAVARAAKAGKSMEECVQIAERYIREQKVFFMVDTLEYLQKGGRIAKASALVGTLLNITPILSLNDEGEVYGLDKVRGKNKAFNRVFELMSKRFPLGSSVSIGILHGNNIEAANKWKEKVLSMYDVKECVTTPLGPIIGTHAGPGTVACVLVPVDDE
ncbi:DegV family protein [Hazenella coriacea]|uniref:DegV family protein with EDD domain n=1 Tax=Hazenella coriacea TaxID=1179467 RepID=A0A4R3L0P3_9BACL|nr:DegV family protein [Hazenella coriacea]TCS93093.1 DegV family protein with EDD domain [Hazenella coriacea]